MTIEIDFDFIQKQEMGVEEKVEEDPPLVATAFYDGDDCVAKLLQIQGCDRGLFDNGRHSEDIGLLIPEGISTGFYILRNFRVVNVSRDWESGYVDDWDIEADWSELYPLPDLKDIPDS